MSKLENIILMGAAAVAVTACDGNPLESADYVPAVSFDELAKAQTLALDALPANAAKKFSVSHDEAGGSPEVLPINWTVN